ncbi:MAG TPA: LLM class flavin-dependent oxidoreductase [Paraburkholderia sp.]|jgi:luciferase family oxidoreductase group 1
MPNPIPFSVLDFAPIRSGETAAHALRQTVDVARLAETLGFTRYWVAEHHGVQTVASAATSVVIGHIAGLTSTIRVGSGGIMLPNHTPFVIAEQFGTLESLYPGRIDLGVGRASGSADEVAKVLRSTPEARERFPDDLRDLQSFFREPEPESKVRAVPGAGLDVPIWVLASSPYSAQEAARLGLPLAFATHIGPDARDASIAAYRSAFEPSAVLDKPYVLVAGIVTAAQTDEEARYLFSSMQQMSLRRLRGTSFVQLQPPIADFDTLPTDDERTRLNASSRAAITGDPQQVEQKLAALIEETGADEVMALSFIHDLDARRRSLEIVGKVRDNINARRSIGQ